MLSILYKKRHLPSAPFYESHRRQPSIPTARARIWGLQADPQTLAEPHAQIKHLSRLQPGKPSEDLPYGQSGIRRLPACLRYAPASSQSSSIHNSLRSIKQTAVWRLESSSPENFGDSAMLPLAKSLHLLSKFSPPEATRLQQSMPLLSPQGKNDRLRYRSAERTVSTPWPARLQLR